MKKTNFLFNFFAIIIVFSLIIIAVGLVVTKFMITNFIDEEIQNLGSLKAMGYKSSDKKTGANIFECSG